MRTTCVLLAAIAIAATTGSAVWGAPSFGGYTGLLLVPNADVLDAGSFNVGYFTVDTSNKPRAFVGNYGIEGSVEVGINRLRTDETTQTLLNAKYAIRKETEKKVALAAGIVDATGQVGRTIYIVGSKSVGKQLRVFDKEITNVRVHFGVGSGGQLDGLLAGASAVLGNRLALLAEYDSDRFNVGARLYLVEGLRAHAGFFSVGSDNDFGLGVSFTKNY